MKFYDGKADYKVVLKEWEKNVVEVSKIFGKLNITKGGFTSDYVEFSGKTEDNLDVKVKADVEQLVAAGYSISIGVEIEGGEIASARNVTKYKNIQPGTIYSREDQFDMDEVKFFQVVRRTEKTIYIKEIEKKCNIGSSNVYCVPEKDKFLPDRVNKVIKAVIEDDIRARIKDSRSLPIISNLEIIKVWDGKPVKSQAWEHVK